MAKFHTKRGQKCNICSELVSMEAEKGKKKNTTNIWNHLKYHHFPANKEAWEKKEDAAKADSLQSTVTQMFDAQRKW